MRAHEETRELTDSKTMKNSLPLRVGIIGDEIACNIDGDNLLSDLKGPRKCSTVYRVP